MANIPPLSFDDRDKQAVTAHLTQSLEGVNAWEFACEKAQTVFNTILREQQSITDYLGGKPLDSAIENGVLHVIYKGLGVVFVLGAGKTSFGSTRLRAAADLPVADDTIVYVKFWIAASSVPE